jgi:hypothetical protein
MITATLHVPLLRSTISVRGNSRYTRPALWWHSAGYTIFHCSRMVHGVSNYLQSWTVSARNSFLLQPTTLFNCSSHQLIHNTTLTNFKSRISAIIHATTFSKGDAQAIVPTAASFLSLPEEIRLQVYRYLLPHQAMPSEYTWLHRTCRQTRAEFDHEALKQFPPLYKTFLHELSYVVEFHPRRP